MNGKGDKWRGGWNQEYADNFDNIFRKRNKLMSYELVQKSSNEVVSLTYASNLNEAKLFFMGRKDMNEKQFDELYYVREEEKNIRK